jgi:hypothetical protein
MTVDTEVEARIRQEAEGIARQNARYRAKAARWDLDVAVFFFAVLTAVVILLFQEVRPEVVTGAAAVGLALGWLMGWKKGRNLYPQLYREELLAVERELRQALGEVPGGTVEDQIQKALRDRGTRM